MNLEAFSSAVKVSTSVNNVSTCCNWRYFYISTKSDQFTQSTIGKPNKKAVLNYLDGHLTRFAVNGLMKEEFHSYLGKEEFDKKKISTQDIATGLINHNKDRPKHIEDIKAFCLSIMG